MTHLGCSFHLRRLAQKFPYVRCAFRLRRLAQNGRRVLLLSKGLVLLARRARFLSYVHFLGRRGISGTFCGRRFAWQVQAIGHFFIRVAGVALSALLVLDAILRGKHSTWWNCRTCWKGLKSRCVKLSSCLIWDMMMIPRGRCSTSDDPCSFFVAGAILCRPQPKKWLKPRWNLVLAMFNVHFSWWVHIWWKFSMCPRNSRDFGRVRSLSLWRGANCEIAPLTLLALCTCQIPLTVAWWWF